MNKNKKIVNKNKLIEEMKVKMYSFNKQIVEKDLEIDQVKATRYVSKAKV